jgi:Family of unknown function (DUF6387)
MVKKIAPWFDRSIYQKRYDLEYWRQMISDRIWCKQLLDSRSISSKAWVTEAENRLSETRSHTSFRGDDTQKGFQFIELNFRRAICQPEAQQPAFPLRLNDLADYFSLAKRSPNASGALSKYGAYKENLTQGPVRFDGLLITHMKPQPSYEKEEFEETHPFWTQPLTTFPEYESLPYLHGYVPLMVNLDKPDKDILDSLKSLRVGLSPLSSTKKRAKKTLQKDINKEINKWEEFGVLAYFDLKFSSKISGKRITNDQIYNLIWPIEQYQNAPYERIKKTTIRYFNKIFTQETLNRLR